jgi:hypothetical protein
VERLEARQIADVADELGSRCRRIPPFKTEEGYTLSLPILAFTLVEGMENDIGDPQRITNMEACGEMDRVGCAESPEWGLGV